MLNFSKKILEKVSFDPSLFQKELKKAIKFLNGKDALVLYSWCIITYGDRYKDIILATFTEASILN